MSRARRRRAKTDRLDTELLKRGFLGWLRGERGHCSMVRVPTIAEEDAKRPNRERECLVKERAPTRQSIKAAIVAFGHSRCRTTRSYRKCGMTSWANSVIDCFTSAGADLAPLLAVVHITRCGAGQFDMVDDLLSADRRLRSALRQERQVSTGWWR